MSTVIITESGCDLTREEATRIGAEVIPMYVLFGQERLRDGVDIDRAAFFARMAREQPETEPPTREDFQRAFTRQVDQGNDVLCITMSAQLSKSFEHARAAATPFAQRVCVVDALGASGMQVLIVQYASELCRAGMSLAEIVQHLDFAHLKHASYFAVPDMTSLGKSGRLAKPLVALGSMLNVSLVLKMSETGAIGPAGQSRSFEKTCEIMVAALVRSLERSPKARIAVSHVESPSVAASVAQSIERELGFRPAAFTVHDATLTIAAHLGVGAVGVFAILPG